MKTSRQAYDVNITSPQRRCNVMTLHRRWGDIIFTSHDVNITSPQRRCNVMTLHRRWGNVIFSIDVEATLYLRPWRKYNVASTSMQLHDVASTLRRRYIYVHDVNITSPQRRCNVMTLHRRWGDVIFTSCARWDMLWVLIRIASEVLLMGTHRPQHMFTWRNKKKKYIYMLPSYLNLCNIYLHISHLLCLPL